MILYVGKKGKLSEGIKFTAKILPAQVKNP